MATATQNLTIEAHHCDNRITYLVTFCGPRADQMAADYITTRSSTHAFCAPFLDGDMPMDLASWPLTDGLLHPVCEHGMYSACYGPDHWCRPDEIMQGM